MKLQGEFYALPRDYNDGKIKFSRYICPVQIRAGCMTKKQNQIISHALKMSKILRSLMDT